MVSRTGKDTIVIRVLIAADESDASVDAARVAHRLFGDNAVYWMINVSETMVGTELMWGYPYAVTMPIAVYPPAISDQDQQRAEEDAERHAADVAEETAVTAEPLGAVGDPADAIVAAARRHDVDVIVVGSHERGWFSRLFRGSVSTDVISAADIPVLVVK